MPSPPRTVLRVRLFEERLTPVVSAFDIAPAVAPTGGLYGVVQIGAANSNLDSSGVVVGNGRYVLTAAHAVDADGDKTPDAAAYTIQFNMPTGAIRLQAAKADITINPGWQGSSRIDQGNDIAVIRLPSLAPTGTQITSELYTSRDELGQVTTFYGYGRVGTGTTGEQAGTDPNDAGIEYTPEIQRLRIGGTGAFSLTFNGEKADLPGPVNAAAIQAAVAGFGGVFGVKVFAVSSDSNPNNGTYEVVFSSVDPSHPGFDSYNVPQIEVVPTPGFNGPVSASTLVDGSRTMAKRVGSATFDRTGDNGQIGSGFPSIAGASVLGGGDSGGPAYIAGKLAGLGSWGEDGSKFGDATYWARISQFATTFINPIIEAKTVLLLDMNAQPDGNDGRPDVIDVSQSGAEVSIIVNGQLYFAGRAETISSVNVRSSSDEDTLRTGGFLTVGVNRTNGASPPVVVNEPKTGDPGTGGNGNGQDDGNGTPPPGTPIRYEAIGAPTGGDPRVRVLDATTGLEVFSFLAFDPTFQGGVSVALGDVTGDGIPDIVTAAGAGGAPHIKVFDGTNGTEIRSFYAYEDSFRGGVNVAVGDVTGDGIADIIAGAGVGGAPRVRAVDGKTGEEILSFFAYDSEFRGGVLVAASDLNGDGKAEIVTGVGPGGGPNVKVWVGGTETFSFFGMNEELREGASVRIYRDSTGQLRIAVRPATGGPGKSYTVAADGSLDLTNPIEITDSVLPVVG